MTNPLLIAALAGVGLFFGLLLMLAGQGMRRQRGLGGGQTISLDRITLTSHLSALTGRPDRLIRLGDQVIPEEWKSGRVLRPWHRAQMGVYFLLIEEELKTVPPYGVIVCGDGKRHRIENDARLRAWVLELAHQIRTARATIGRPIPVSPRIGQCPPCGQRAHCRQARL